MVAMVSPGRTLSPVCLLMLPISPSIGDNKIMSSSNFSTRLKPWSSRLICSWSNWLVGSFSCASRRACSIEATNSVFCWTCTA